MSKIYMWYIFYIIFKCQYLAVEMKLHCGQHVRLELRPARKPTYNIRAMLDGVRTLFFTIVKFSLVHSDRWSYILLAGELYLIWKTISFNTTAVEFSILIWCCITSWMFFFSNKLFSIVLTMMMNFRYFNLK